METTNAALAIGTVVVNFGQTAVVVGHWAPASPSSVYADLMTGWPILRVLGSDGKPRGGKWAADPAKCEVR